MYFIHHDSIHFYNSALPRGQKGKKVPEGEYVMRSRITTISKSLMKMQDEERKRIRDILIPIVKDLNLLSGRSQKLQDLLTFLQG